MEPAVEETEECRKVRDGVTTSETSGDRQVFRSGLSIFPSQLLAVHQLIATLVERLPARFALLTDTSGQVIAAQGQPTTQQGLPIDQVALGALVAGDLAASQEIARLTGEYQDYQLILRQGKESHILISEAGSSLVLLAQVGDQVPLGWACIQILDTARHVAEVLLSMSEQADLYLPELKGEPLGDKVSSTLDSIWKEESDVR